MQISLDVESVLANTNEAVLQSTDKVDRDHLLGDWDLSDEQWQIYSGVSDAVWRHNPASIPPEEPMLDRYVEEIRENHTVDVVTARLHVDENIEWWLEEHGIEYRNFISTDTPKYELDYDVYIDDNPDMFDQCPLLLRHQPWNENLDTEAAHPWCHRIYSLGEVSEYL